MMSVIAVASSPVHGFHKPLQQSIRLLEGLGVEGDAHKGERVQHLARIRRDPTQPNLRQVHLIHAELFDELRDRGFEVKPGEIGENVTTRGVDLLALPAGTRLHLGPQAVVEVTGLRNPCKQLNAFQDGLMYAVLDQDPGGNLVRKTGVMSIVVAGGDVRPGDAIRVELPAEPYRPLDVV